MEAISDLPMLHDIDADYSPQYVKLARILRDKIESGKYHRGDTLPAAELAQRDGVSVRVAYAALAMLAANRYVDRPGSFTLPRHLAGGHVMRGPAPAPSRRWPEVAAPVRARIRCGRWPERWMVRSLSWLARLNRRLAPWCRSCTGKDRPMSASSLPRDDLSLLSRLERLDASTVSDADKSLRVLPAAIRLVSARSRLLGRAVTANARDDLLSVLGALRHSGPGDVLVVAAGGSRHAVAGELFASEAARRGMAGIVIDGFCRDTATLKRMTMPIYARGATPRAARAMVMPEVNVPVLLGNVTVNPGDILLGDDDGIVVATEAEMAAAIDKAEAIQLTEDALCSSIAEGVSLFDKLNFDEHVENLRAGKASLLSFDA